MVTTTYDKTVCQFIFHNSGDSYFDLVKNNCIWDISWPKKPFFSKFVILKIAFLRSIYKTKVKKSQKLNIKKC